MDNLLTWLIPEVQRTLKQLSASVTHAMTHGIIDGQLLVAEQSNLQRLIGAIEVASQSQTSLPVILQRLSEVLAHWQRTGNVVVQDDLMVVTRTCQAIHEFTSVTARGTAYSEICLFAPYSALCLVADNKSCHPADLWPQHLSRATTAALLAPNSQEWFCNKAQQGSLHVSATALEQCESGLHNDVLALIRSTDANSSASQVALQSLQVLADAWLLRSNTMPQRVATLGLFRLILSQYADGHLEMDAWLKRLLLGALTQFQADADEQLLHLSFYSYIGWQKADQTQARLREQGEVYPPALIASANWQSLKGAAYSRALFGLVAPVKMDALLLQIERTKSALSSFSTDAESATTALPTTAQSLGALAEHLIGFQPNAESLAYELGQVVSGAQTALIKRNVQVELATILLILEAMLGHPTVQSPADFELRFTELARRLRAVREDQPAGAFAPWMLALQQDHAWHKTNEQLVGEIKARLLSMEQVFQARDFQNLEMQAMSLRSIARSMKWDSLAKAAQAMALQIRDGLGEQGESWIANNLAAMGLFADLQGQSRHSVEALFAFDDRSQQLQVQGRPQPLHSPAQIAPDSAPSGNVDMQGLFLEEAAELLMTAQDAHSALAADPQNTEQVVVLRRAFHTLKGGARMVGMPEFADIAWQAEQQLNHLLAEKTPASADLLAACQDAMTLLGEKVPASTSVSVPELTPPAIVQPQDWLDLPATKVVGDLTISLALYNAYLNEADEWSRQLSSALSEWRLDTSAPLPSMTLTWAHAIAGSSATVGFTSLSTLAKAMEHLIERVHEDRFEHPDLAATLDAAANDVCRLLHQFAAGFIKEPAPTLLNQLEHLKRASSVANASAQSDAMIEADLAAVFAEEFAVLLPHLGASMRAWLLGSKEGVANLEARSEALRALHTLKGSARLVGRQLLAQQAHDLESAIESYAEMPSPAQSDSLLQQYDQMSGLELPSAALIEPHMDASVTVPESRTMVAAASPLAGMPAFSAMPSGEVIRVKLGLIDRLVNQSGEILIARARMAAEAQRAQHTLTDMTVQVSRLRDQLRELEMQTESQMQSRQAQLGDTAQGFDPLELDRFTRTQELTRFMAEALSDVSTFQRSLQRSLNATEDDLAAQSRQAKDLQRYLLQTRMVPFDSVAERLHRLVRMASQELGKLAELTITGGALELDRSVLERVTPAFEHLLRNSIVHGIEMPDTRATLDKPQTGQIRISMVQNGNDVWVTVQDDGQGVNAQAVLERARDIDPSTADHNDPAQLIFMSGLSTAPVVSELAGRGIGMDVVRAQVLALGGRIEVQTQPGVGTSFKLMLPLTTAITQIVLVRTGSRVTALPANLIQTVLRAKPAQIEAAAQSHVWTVGEQISPFYRLSHLLQYSAEYLPMGAASQPTPSVLMLSSASQTLALCVDEVLGNQEAVVKNLGPQLSKMPGLAGMTVLPTGQTVLIYNPVALATVYGAGLAQSRELDASSEMRSVGNPGNIKDLPVAPTLASLVMVVDDSITMRRVLQRLLTREGYRSTQAADGKQALDMLRVERPSLVLSDVEMPRMDGFELLRQIRSSEQLQDLPVVMITSRIADKHRDHAKSLGANEYLGKPYPEEELIALLRKYAAV